MVLQSAEYKLRVGTYSSYLWKPHGEKYRLSHPYYLEDVIVKSGSIICWDRSSVSGPACRYCGIWRVRSSDLAKCRIDCARTPTRQLGSRLVSPRFNAGAVGKRLFPKKKRKEKETTCRVCMPRTASFPCSSLTAGIRQHSDLYPLPSRLLDWRCRYPGSCFSPSDSKYILSPVSSLSPSDFFSPVSENRCTRSSL